MNKKLLLVVASSVESATKYAKLANTGDKVRAKAFCPPKGLRGLLNILQNQFSDADGVLLTADAFTSTCFEPKEAAEVLRKAKPSLRILVLKIGKSMKAFDSKEILQAGADGLYEGMGMNGDDLAQWIISGAFGQTSKSPYLEKLVKGSRGRSSSVIPSGFRENIRDDDGTDDSPPRGPLNSPSFSSGRFPARLSKNEEDADSHPDEAVSPAAPAPAPKQADESPHPAASPVPAPSSASAQPPQPAAIPPKPMPPSLTATKPRRSASVTTENPDVATLGETLTKIFENLENVISRCHEQLATAREVVTGIHQISGGLLEKIDSAPETKRAKLTKTKPRRAAPAKKPAKLEAARKSPSKKDAAVRPHKEPGGITFAGKKIILPGGAAQVMNILIKGQGRPCSKEQLVNGGGASSLFTHLASIRTALGEAFGENGPAALVTHRGQGYSLDPKALH